VAALGSVALGAFRTQRRAGAGLADAAGAMDATIREVGVPGAFVNVVLARWHGPSARLQWLTCGDRGPLLVTAAGRIETLDGAVHDALGVGSADRAFALCGRRLEPASASCSSPTASWAGDGLTAAPSASTACARPWRPPAPAPPRRCARSGT
jgi:hypothetical protein